jgi:hypothetical protein
MQRVLDSLDSAMNALQECEAAHPTDCDCSWCDATIGDGAWFILNLIKGTCECAIPYSPAETRQLRATVRALLEEELARFAEADVPHFASGY